MFTTSALQLLAHFSQSINVVECKEFRRLLLFLREGLCDTDVPHRTSVRNKIIETFKQYLVSLKKELGVSTCVQLRSFLVVPSNLCYLGCTRTNIFHNGYVVIG